ncbi:MAG: amidohydrolase family protein [Oscillospiraceae bacterium]|nr:amidohydrolase family protein [Oscillospiraceae bacterium]
MNGYLIRNCDIADFDTLKTKRAEILIEGERIKKIAEKIEPREYEGATILDAHGMLAMPSFTDAHTHMNQTFFKGPMDDYPITQWLIRLFQFEDIMDDETVYYSSLLGCLSSLRFGTTTINEMGDWVRVDPILQAFEDSGIRATFGVSTTDVPENDATPIITVDEALRRSEVVYKKAHGRNGGLIRASVAPAGLPACSKALVQALKAFANERGLVFHTHLGEGKKETEDVMRMYGLRGEGEALYEFGILDKNTLLAHSIWLKDFELDMIKECGANPVHCPNTNLKISDGTPPIAAMLKRGINVAMGCDGEASSSTRDMIREGRAGAYLQKVTTLDPTVMDAGTTLKMMTRNGARALGYDDVGEIKEGNRADLVLINTDDDLSLVSPEYRVGNVLYAGDGHAVDTVFCNGRLMVRNKKLQNFDEEAILSKCRASVSKLNARIAEMDRRK